MNFIGYKCPVCGFIFKEGDDVVVCPDCGTPHHRDCWASRGGCFNEGRHASGFKFDLGDSVGAAPGESAGGVYCPRCGFKNETGTTFCKNCGERIGASDEDRYADEAQTPFGGFSRESDGRFRSNTARRYSPYQNPFVAQAERLYGGKSVDGIPAGEVAEYVQARSDYYIGRFLKMQDDGTKISWNWSSFLFPFFWAFYRKMAGAGVAILLIMFSLNLLTNAAVPMIFEKAVPDEFAAYEEDYNRFFDAYRDFVQSGGESGAEEMMTASQNFVKSPVLIASIVIDAALQLIAMVCMGFLGNYIYKKRVIKTINVIRERCEDANTYHMVMRGAGGVSVWGVVLPVLVYMVGMMFSRMF